MRPAGDAFDKPALYGVIMATPNSATWRARIPKSLVDVVIAGLLFALNMTLLLPLADRSNVPNPLPLGIGLLVVHCGCLAWRRMAPIAVLIVNLASALIFFVLGFPPVALGVAVLVALYTAGSRAERRLSLPLALATVAVMAVALATDSRGADLSTIVGNALVFAVTWYLGDSTRERRRHVHALEERTKELEQARDELARQAVAQERVRIARELHDIVAHSMGMIAVQAGVGRHVIDSKPEDAKQSLETIERASKSALQEIRGMLGLLRSSGEAASRAPSPGLDELPALIDEVRTTGIDAELQLEAPPRPVPLGVEVTVYRIVQEALTNVIKHASATRARACVWFAEDALRVEVVDDGVTATTGNSGGLGLAGMRERVALHGGTFESGPLPEGGFKVSASLPLEQEPS